MLRIIIADDHTIFRNGLIQLLLNEFPAAFIKGVSDAEDLVKNVTEEKWELVISDIDMPGRSGLDALVQIKKIAKKLPVLMLSFHPEDQYALHALKAGSSGYLNKYSLPDEYIKAIHKVLLGKKYISAGIAEKLANNLNANADKLPHEHLSGRDFEVMKLFAEGKTNSVIAAKLSVRATSVSARRGRIMSKMSLKTNSDLTKYAIENRLI